LWSLAGERKRRALPEASVDYIGGGKKLRKP
jgi:hypothetical protein